MSPGQMATRASAPHQQVSTRATSTQPCGHMKICTGTSCSGPASEQEWCLKEFYAAPVSFKQGHWRKVWHLLLFWSFIDICCLLWASASRAGRLAGESCNPHLAQITLALVCYLCYVFPLFKTAIYCANVTPYFLSSSEPGQDRPTSKDTTA